MLCVQQQLQPRARQGCDRTVTDARPVEREILEVTQPPYDQRKTGIGDFRVFECQVAECGHSGHRSHPRVANGALVQLQEAEFGEASKAPQPGVEGRGEFFDDDKFDSRDPIFAAIGGVGILEQP